MVTELAILDLKPGREAEFEAAFDEAKAIIASAAGFNRLELQHCLERPSRYFLLVEWQRLEDHTEGVSRIAGVLGVARVAAPLLRAVPDCRALHLGHASARFRSGALIT